MRPLPIAIALLLVACGGDPAPADEDASSADDAGAVDGGPVEVDGGALVDAARPDSGPRDAGVDAPTPDGGPHECEVVPNIGCDAAAGEACYWVAVGGGRYVRQCLPEGTHGEGETCDSGVGPNDCAAGLFCDSGSPDSCLRYCNDTVDVCPSHSCRIRLMYDEHHGICAP